MNTGRTDKLDLEWLFTPLSYEEFVARHWKEVHFWSQGEQDRFAGLLSWSGFNELLARHWREPARVRLVQSGVDVSPDRYVSPTDNGIGRALLPQMVLGEIQRGATIVLHAIDELHEPLRLLAEALESRLQGSCRVNVYASWGAINGLGLHSDDLEILIFQIAGRKLWRLYDTDLEGRATADVAFERVLEPGDLLYIPRGQFHIAMPLDEPTFHLTVSLKYPRTGALLKWIAARLTKHEFGQRDLPDLMDVGNRSELIGELMREMSGIVQFDLLQDIDTFLAERRIVRPRFAFPWNVTSSGLPDSDDFRVRLTSPVAIKLSRNNKNEVVECYSEGRRLRLPSLAYKVVEILNDCQEHSLQDICRSMASHVGEKPARMILGMLSKQNVIVVLI